MRGMSRRGGSISSWPCALGACLLVLAAIWLVGISSAIAAAANCANSQLRSGPSEHLPDCRAVRAGLARRKGRTGRHDAAAAAPCAGIRMRTRRTVYGRVHECWGGVWGRAWELLPKRVPGHEGRRQLADDGPDATDTAGSHERQGGGRLRLLGKSLADDPARPAAAADRERPGWYLQPVSASAGWRLFARDRERSCGVASARVRRLLRRRRRTGVRGRLQRLQPRDL